MKTLLLSILFTGLGLVSFGQNNKFGLGIEYSPNFANATSGKFSINDYGYRLAQNCILKAQYMLTARLYTTAGIGYMDTREFSTIDLPGGPQEIYKIESHNFHHYIVFPVGLKYYFGSLYIQSEMAIGSNTGNTSLDTYYTGSPSGGSIFTEKHKDINNFHEVNKMTYPAFLTIGHDIPLKSITISLGFKGYYTFNTIGSSYYNSRHAYGFGMVVGVRM